MSDQKKRILQLEILLLMTEDNGKEKNLISNLTMLRQMNICELMHERASWKGSNLFRNVNKN